MSNTRRDDLTFIVSLTWIELVIGLTWIKLVTDLLRIRGADFVFKNGEIPASCLTLLDVRHQLVLQSLSQRISRRLWRLCILSIIKGQFRQPNYVWRIYFVWRNNLNMPRRAQYPCGICNKACGANTIECSLCLKWIHRYSRSLTKSIV